MEDDQNLFIKLLTECQNTDHSLRVGNLSKRNCDDRYVIKTRERLKTLYKKVLFLNYEEATSKTVETSLWSSCFYKVIEEYRQRIRKALQEYIKADERNKQEKREVLRNHCFVLRKFLESSSVFYHELIQDFQTKYNLKLDTPIPEGERNNLSHQYISCHRCLIFLGDLARYHRDLYRDPTQKEWTQAASYYTKALRLWPENGHPHNQLAVLCSYQDDDFRTFYHYFRSIAVKIPFTTARDNLMRLFEKNRKKYLSKKTTRSSRGNNPTDRKSDFMISFVRLHGILFTKTSLETCKKIREEVIYDFEKLLQEDSITESTVLKMVLANIFAVHNSCQDSTYSPTSVPSVALQQSITLAMHFFSCLLQQTKFATSTRKPKNVTFSDEQCMMAEKDTDGKNQQETKLSPMLMAISVFASWLTTHPEYLRCTDDNPIWLRLRELVVEVSNQALSIINIENVKTDSKGPIAPLTEDIKCQGFLPLEDVLSNVDFSLESVKEGPDSDHIRWSKFIKFSLLATEYEWTNNEYFIYYNSRENRFSTSGLVVKKAEKLTEKIPPEESKSVILTPKPPFPSDQKLTTIEPPPLIGATSINSMDRLSTPHIDDHYVNDSEDSSDDDVGDEILFAPGKTLTPSPLSTTRVVGSERARISSTEDIEVPVLTNLDSYELDPLFNTQKLINTEFHKQGIDIMFPNRTLQEYDTFSTSLNNEHHFSPLSTQRSNSPLFSNLNFPNISKGSLNNFEGLDSGITVGPEVDINVDLSHKFPFSFPKNETSSLWSDTDTLFKAFNHPPPDTSKYFISFDTSGYPSPIPNPNMEGVNSEDDEFVSPPPGFTNSTTTPSNPALFPNQSGKSHFFGSPDPGIWRFSGQSSPSIMTYSQFSFPVNEHFAQQLPQEPYVGDG